MKSKIIIAFIIGIIIFIILLFPTLPSHTPFYGDNTYGYVCNATTMLECIMGR